MEEMVLEKMVLEKMVCLKGVMEKMVSRKSVMEKRIETFKNGLREYREEINRYDRNYTKSKEAKNKVDELDNKADGYLKAVLDFGIIDKEIAEDIFDDIIRGA